MKDAVTQKVKNETFEIYRKFKGSLQLAGDRHQFLSDLFANSQNSVR